MPLEIFTNPDARPNIKDFSLDSPEVEPRVHFDPKRDITEEDWEQVANMCDMFHREDMEIRKRISFYSSIATVDRSKLPEITPREKDQMNEFIKQKFSDDSVLEIAAVIKIVDPSSAPMSRESIEKLVQGFDNLREASRWEVMVSRAANLILVDPSVSGPLQETDWQHILEMAEHWRSSWKFLPFDALLVRIVSIDPNKISLLHEEDWIRLMGQLLEFRRKGETRNFISLAANLTVLANAERLQAHALPSSRQQPPLPEMRKF